MFQFQDEMSNDVLYGHDDNMITELQKMISTIIKIVESELENMISNRNTLVADKILFNLVKILALFSDKKVIKLLKLSSQDFQYHFQETAILMQEFGKKISINSLLQQREKVILKNLLT